MKQIAKKKRFWLLLCLGLGLAYGLARWGQPMMGWLTDHNRWIMTFQDLGPWAWLVFVITHVVATACGLPATVLVIAGGAVFGLVWGTLWSLVGATLGAIAAFSIARYLLRDWFLKRFHHHPLLIRLNRLLMAESLRCVLAVRFVPISPFSLVNFLFGLTSVSLKPYSIGTFLGIIPGTFAYTWLGVTGVQVLMGEGYLAFILAMTLLVGLSLLPLLLRVKTG